MKIGVAVIEIHARVRGHLAWPKLVVHIERRGAAKFKDLLFYTSAADLVPHEKVLYLGTGPNVFLVFREAAVFFVETEPVSFVFVANRCVVRIVVIR